MTRLVKARRVVVITEKVIERGLLEQFVKMGAKGYNCVYCSGKGEHGIVEDLMSGPESSCVRIEMITTQQVAERILDYVHSDAISHYPVTAFLDSVEVDSRDTFYRNE